RGRGKGGMIVRNVGICHVIRRGFRNRLVLCGGRRRERVLTRVDGRGRFDRTGRLAASGRRFVGRALARGDDGSLDRRRIEHDGGDALELRLAIVCSTGRHAPPSTQANSPASPSMRRRAIAAYSGLSSIRMALRFKRSATRPVVPAPPKGSSTIPPSGQPARMHGSISAGGKVAKWASEKG